MSSLPGALPLAGDLMTLSSWRIKFFNDWHSVANTQELRYLLFNEGGIFSVHAYTFVGTKLITYIGITLKNIDYK